MLLAPRLTFCSNLANWNALFLLNYIWQLGGETGLLNHLPGFQWDWLILQMSLKQCKHRAAVAIRVNCKAKPAGEERHQRVIECVLKQTFKYWLTQRLERLHWSGLGLEVSGKCQGVLRLSPDNAMLAEWVKSQDPNYSVNEIILLDNVGIFGWKIKESSILKVDETKYLEIIKKQGNFKILHCIV